MKRRNNDGFFKNIFVGGETIFIEKNYILRKKNWGRKILEIIRKIIQRKISYEKQRTNNFCVDVSSNYRTRWVLSGKCAGGLCNIFYEDICETQIVSVILLHLWILDSYKFVI